MCADRSSIWIQGERRTCDYLQTFTEACNWANYQAACPVTCNQCSTCADSDDFLIAIQGSFRTCEWIRNNEDTKVLCRRFPRASEACPVTCEAEGCTTFPTSSPTLCADTPGPVYWYGGAKRTCDYFGTLENRDSLCKNRPTLRDLCEVTCEKDGCFTAEPTSQPTTLAPTSNPTSEPTSEP